MRVAGIQALSGPVELIDVANSPAPAGDEVLIEVRAAGVANWDDVVRRGDWDVGIGPPMALGVEAAPFPVSSGSFCDSVLSPSC